MQHDKIYDPSKGQTEGFQSENTHRCTNEPADKDNQDIPRKLELLINCVGLGENQIDVLLSLLPIGISISTDISCREITHNPVAASFLRIPDWDSLSHSADTPPSVRILRNGIELSPDEMPMQRASWFGEIITGDELEFVWEDGTCKTSLWNAKPLYNDTGIITGAIAVFEDITTRKKMEKELKAYQEHLSELVEERTKQLERANSDLHREIAKHLITEQALSLSEIKYANIFHYCPDIITISTVKEGRYVEINDAFTELTGHKRHESIGHTVIDLGVWAFPSERDVMVQQIQEQGSIRNFEMHLRVKSGEVRVCIVSGGIIDIEGEPHLLCVIKDITERKRMEEKLRLSEDRFSKAFHVSPTPMCISTLEEGRVVDINDSYCRVIGYSFNEIFGRAVNELGIWVNETDRTLVIKKIMKMESVRNREIHFLNKSGEIRLGLFSAVRLDIDGQLCLLNSLLDVTELKKMEVEMTRLDRLNLVGEMAASIGHEIRNPMTTVRGYLQILRENKDYIKEIDYFDLMIEELDTANSIITEFLSLANNKMVEIKPGNLNSVINKLLPLVQANAMIKDQYIKVELNSLPEVLLDEKEMRQLILNLVYNGLEAMSSSGSVTIKTFIEKGKVVLAVEDQGCGIDHELLDKLGTPFFTTKEHGTGLGLAVCYRIAGRHNAKIDIETSSAGTIFYIRFPHL